MKPVSPVIEGQELTRAMIDRFFEQMLTAISTEPAPLAYYVHPLVKLWWDFECVFRYRRSVYWPRWKRWVRRWESLEWRWCKYTTGHARRKLLLTREITYPFHQRKTVAAGYVCLDCRAKFAEQLEVPCP